MSVGPTLAVWLDAAKDADLPEESPLALPLALMWFGGRGAAPPNTTAPQAHPSASEPVQEARAHQITEALGIDGTLSQGQGTHQRPSV